MFRTAFVAALLLSTTAIAHADWQYTKWGMSSKEVAEASGGAATIKKDRTTQKDRLVAPYKSGEHLFETRFGFDESGKLASVMLEPSDKSKCAEIHGVLANAYGPPQAYGYRRSMPKWWDRKNGNEVTLIDILDNCMIQYAPIKQAGAPGGL